MLLGGRTRGEFPEKVEERTGGLLVGQAIENHSGSEVRRGLIEAHADEIFVAPSGERIHDRGQLHRPLVFCGEDDRAGASDRPVANCFLFPCGMPRPTVADDVKMKSWREAHIGFKSKCFLLLAEAADYPFYWQWAREQANGHAGVVKPTRGQVQSCFEVGTTGPPFEIRQASLAEAGSLNPLQHTGGTATVVAYEPAVPKECEYRRYADVD